MSGNHPRTFFCWAYFHPFFRQNEPTQPKQAQSDLIISEQTLLIYRAMSEQCFPRGGKIKRKAAESGGDRADEDKLFDDQPKKKAKKQKKVKQKKSKEEDEKRLNGAVDEVSQVDPLKQDDLEAQMVLLGRVREVGEFQLLVSLPCHLVGSVPVTSISSTYSKLITHQQEDNSAPALSELFSTGQYVSCMVTKVDQAGHKVRNTLSVRPEDVNSSMPATALGPGLVLQCSVKSEEDNVYDIDCGIAGARAVLPKLALGTDSPALVAGQVLWCLVDSVRAQDGLHTLTLSAEPGRLNGAVPGQQCSLTRQTLLPGMRLPITVDKVLPGGLQVRLSNDLVGLVYKTQLDEPADCPDDYNAGAAAHARLLYTLPMLRRVYLSLRPAVARLPAAPPDTGLLQEAAGERLAAQVLDADQHGVRMVLSDGGGVAFAPVWHARRAGAGRWQRGEEARCTLLAFDAMDEVYIASMKGGKEAPKQAPSLAIGAKVTCRVKELLEHGCKVELDGGVFGVIPNHHLTNVPVKNLQTMFPTGKKLKCKVIQSASERHRLVQLTHNARLVNTNLSLASDPDQLKRGNAHHWIVTMVSERGLVVTGYSGLSGFVPAAFAGSALDDFFPGQILNCTVHKVRPAAETSGERRVTLCPVRDAGQQAWRGRLGGARVTGRAAGRLLVITDDGQRAELPAGHLTDVPEHADAALAKYKTGDKLEIVGLVAVGKKLIASAKPLFLEYIKNKRYPASASDVSVGLRLPGCVIHTDEKGVVVAFPGQHPAGTHRIRLQGLCDGWQKDMSSLQQLQHRTLMLHVMSTSDPDSESDPGHLRLSARLDTKKDQGGAVYLSRCLRELSGLVPAQPAVGDSVTGRVMTSDPAGVTLRLPDGRVGVLPGGGPRPAGDTVTASVLQVTPAGHLSLATGEHILPADGQAGVSVGKCYSVRVLAAPDHGYLATALLLPPAPSCLVQLAVRRGLNDLTSGLPRPQPGDTLQVIVKSCEGGVIVCVRADQTEPVRTGRKKNKLTKKPAKKVRPRDKHWKKKKRSGPGTLPTPRRPQSTTSIRYSRFSLQDDS